MADAEALTDTLPGHMHSLSDACTVVDALGPMARKDLMDEFVQLQLLPYEKIFSPGASFYSLCIFTSTHTTLPPPPHPQPIIFETTPSHSLMMHPTYILATTHLLILSLHSPARQDSLWPGPCGPSLGMDKTTSTYNRREVQDYLPDALAALSATLFVIQREDEGSSTRDAC